MKFFSAAVSNPGPRNVNEDAKGIWSLESGLAVVVADGLGGMGGGKKASETAVSDFEVYVSDGHAIGQLELHAMALNIHEHIRTLQRSSSEFSTMATTFTAGVFQQNILLAVHCGDSRIAVARGKGIKRLTKDHSEAQRLLVSGKLSKEEFQEYPRKNILESALGIQGAPNIDDIKFEIVGGDKLFFTTDGVHNIIKLRELRQLAEGSDSPGELIARVVKTIDERGPNDNYTLVTVYAEEAS